MRGTCGTQGCLRAPTSSLRGTPWDFEGALQELLGSSPHVAVLVLQRCLQETFALCSLGSRWRRLKASTCKSALGWSTRRRRRGVG